MDLLWGEFSIRTSDTSENVKLMGILGRHTDIVCTTIHATDFGVLTVTKGEAESTILAKDHNSIVAIDFEDLEDVFEEEEELFVIVNDLTEQVLVSYTGTDGYFRWVDTCDLHKEMYENWHYNSAELEYASAVGVEGASKVPASELKEEE